MRRHITLSRQAGVTTELEMLGTAIGQYDRYVVRSQKALNAGAEILKLGFPDTKSWIGFQYREGEWSFLKKEN